MSVNIYSAALLSSELYTLRFATDNVTSFEVKKSTGIIPFSLPVVNNTLETSNAVITEQSEFIHIGGVEATVNIDFEIAMSSIGTLLSFVTNKISEKHRIEVGEWSGSTNCIFNGIIDSVRIKQEGGDPRLTCNISFLNGANTLAGIGY